MKRTSKCQDSNYSISFLMNQNLMLYKLLFNMKEYYESILALMPGHVYWLDRNNVFLGCNDNQAKNAGLKSRFEIIGKTNYDMPWKSQADELNRINNLVMETGSPQAQEEFAVMQSGPGYYYSQKVPLRNKQNQIMGLLGISLDITELKNTQVALKKAKEQAQAASQAKTQFIANVSHDIRTPLSGIVGMSKFLEDAAKTEEERRFAHWVNESGVQLLNLLNDILDVISLENVDETKVNLETFDLRHFVQELVELERPTTTMKRLALSHDIDPAIPLYVVTDRIKLHRILLNLLGNAIKFTEKGGIYIRVHCLKKLARTLSVKFSIEDTGIGIPKEAQDKVFDRFYKVEASYQAHHNGHGLGLSIAQTYVELLGGVLELKSEEGKGTTFYFSLPLQLGRAEDAKTHAHYETLPIEPAAMMPVSPMASSQTGPHVLIVEDNLTARFIAQKIATDAGCQTQTAESAEQALPLIEATAFDLILTDLGLPGQSGTELAQQIRILEQRTKRKPLPIVALSAHNSKSIQQDCLQAGMNQVLTKPLDATKMQALIEYFHLHTPSPTSNTGKGMEPRPQLSPTDKADLFHLQDFPIFDEKKALQIYNGNGATLTKLIEMMLHQQLPSDQHLLEEAYQNQDWTRLGSQAHKIKAGAVYCGLTRLQMACQYLEQYCKTGETAHTVELYQQLLGTLQESKSPLEAWLETHQ